MPVPYVTLHSRNQRAAIGKVMKEEKKSDWCNAMHY